MNIILVNLNAAGMQYANFCPQSWSMLGFHKLGEFWRDMASMTKCDSCMSTEFFDFDRFDDAGELLIEFLHA